MIGPTKITHPATTINQCGECEFHKVTLFRSGRNPQRNYYCKHPDVAFPKGSPDHTPIEMYAEETPETPDWCPVLNKKTSQ